MQDDYPELENVFDTDYSPGYSHRTLKAGRRLRDAAMAEYPAAFENSGDARFYNRLLQYLLRPHLLEHNTNQIVLPATTIAELDEKRYNSNYKALSRLKAFMRATGLPLYITEHRYTRSRARTVVPHWPARIEEALKGEQKAAGTKRERVYFDDGKVFGRSRQLKEREKIEQLVQEANEAVPPAPDQEWLLAYLNGSQHQKTANRLIKEHWADALALAQALPETTDHEIATKRHTLFILDETYTDSSLAYRTSPKTARIHAFGPNLTQLPRRIRKTLLGSGVTLDLVAAQAALIAHVWNCPKLSRMLSSNRPFWSIVLERAKLPPEAKGAVKKALYSAAFGMARQNIRKDFADALRASGIRVEAADVVGVEAADLLAKRFVSSTMIREVLRARRRRVGEITKAGGLTDAFGRVIVIDGPTSQKRHSQLRSALAVEMQAYEQELMLSMKPAIENERLTVLCWLHDGLSIKARDKEEQARIIKRLCDLVNHNDLSPKNCTTGMVSIDPKGKILECRRTSSAMSRSSPSCSRPRKATRPSPKFAASTMSRKTASTAGVLASAA